MTKLEAVLLGLVVFSQVFIWASLDGLRTRVDDNHDKLKDFFRRETKGK